MNTDTVRDIENLGRFEAAALGGPARLLLDKGGRFDAATRGVVAVLGLGPCEVYTTTWRGSDMVGTKLVAVIS
jgi:hypothetical protein